jgi:hypothetical protein
MFLNLIRSKSALAMFAAVASAAIASSASAFTFTVSGVANGSGVITTDTGDNKITAATVPVPINSSVPLSNLYGAPAISTPAGAVVFDFTQLSSQFRASASSSLYSATEVSETDGKLVMQLTFDTPVSLGGSVYEDGLYATTGAGTVAVNGGDIVIAPVGAPVLETQGADFVSTLKNGVWTATAAIPNFSGLFSTYQLTINNDLIANAPLVAGAGPSTAEIFKKDVILVLTPNTGTGRTPEPASIGLLALGALGLLARRR